MPVEIIPACEEFVDSYAECLDEVARERRFLSFLEAPPKAEVRSFLKGLLARNQIQYYAMDGKTVVGWCDVQRKGMPSQSHSGVLGLGIRKAYRGAGLGNRLMETAIATALEKGMERIELWVMENNQSAIALYLKFGFKVEGKLEKYVKIAGVDYPALMMARLA